MMTMMSHTTPRDKEFHLGTRALALHIDTPPFEALSPRRYAGPEFPAELPPRAVELIAEVRRCRGGTPP